MAGDVRDVEAETKNALAYPFLSGVKYQHLVAGLSGGIVSTLATHPFDLIKLRFAGNSNLWRLHHPYWALYVFLQFMMDQ